MYIENGVRAFSNIMDKLKESPGASKMTKRKLEDDEIKYEMTIEDKYGKKYKYADKSLEPEIIEEELQDGKSYDDNVSKTTLLNIHLLIAIILLFLG